MVEIRIGCAGFSYPEWKTGGFYPSSLNSKSFLQHYAKYFNFVEMNTTFYHLPKLETIQHWNASTPDDFAFSIKVWQNLTHKQNAFQEDNMLVLEEIENQISQFFGALTTLIPKISGILLQFPPRYAVTDTHLAYFQFLMKRLPTWGRYFVEFRHPSWFESSLIGDILDHPRFHVVTAFIPHTSPFFSLKQPMQYIRMIGDRALTRFDHPQRPQTQAKDDLKMYLRRFRAEHSIEEIFVIFNNHFRGFAPHDVISLAKDLDLPYKEYKKNKSLLDFM